MVRVNNFAWEPSMSADSTFTRRRFVRMCASTAALIGANPALLAQPNAPHRHYQRVKLVDEHDRPMTVTNLRVGENYLFYYPYISTPCFLLNLGRPTTPAALETEDGQSYRWSGGIGPNRAIVAFSAICAHKMSHPAREVSFINYRHQPAAFQNAEEKRTQQAQVIYCCSEKSVYDPLKGARVLGGPAKQPLTTIVLEQGPAGVLHATGTIGGELYDKFFEHFSSRLALEFRTNEIRKLVADTATVVPLAQYCRTQILC